MFKNQLQELAQRSCFNLPAYACLREGPDHAPRFKATVNFNGEVFESPNYCTTLRQAEHAAAEVALNTLSRRGPSQSLAARILDETGVYKNLLQETAQRAGVSLPIYSTIRSGPGHLPVFTCTVELANLAFTGDAAKTKKQAEKNAAMAAWFFFKQHAKQACSPLSLEAEVSEEQEQNIIARALARAAGKDERNIGLNSCKTAQSQQSMVSSRVRSLKMNQQSGHTSSGMLAQYHPSTWLVDGSSESQGQRFLHGQHHSGMIMNPGPYRAHLPRAIGAVVGPSRDPSSSSLSRDSIPGSRLMGAGSGTLGRYNTTHVRSMPAVNCRDRHEVTIPVEEHQRDDEEWLSGSKSDVSNESRTSECSVLQSSPNPIIWSKTPSWWNTASSSQSAVQSGVSSSRHGLQRFQVAQPVVLRTAVAVGSAPPRPEPGRDLGRDLEGARQTLSQLNILGQK